MKSDKEMIKVLDQLVLEECDFYLADFNNKEASDLKICNTLFWREVIYN
tara:strand:+ start:526 stop:672 length:147 start_codon:yes stop_codon:yes gene_type:complete